MRPQLEPYIIEYDSLPSTNTEAARQAGLGAREGLCIVSREQTAGRGRESRKWVSPLDAGLYFSIVLRPKIAMQQWPLITLMAAVAVHDAIETAFGIDCDIKWPNDILCRDRKLSGILAETIETQKGPAVILGIGINLSSEAFPPELKGSATSLQEETSGQKPDRELLIKELTRQLQKAYGELHQPVGPATIIAQWSSRSSFTNGKKVRATLFNGVVEGVTRGLEPDGALRIEDARGALHTVRSGDVTTVRPAS
jgi:BirA family biotin operon repressor/biotin-[acetyl-CoA-carboxylase] ligase